MYLHLRCLIPLIIYDHCLQLPPETSSINFQLILESPGCLCKTCDYDTIMAYLCLTIYTHRMRISHKQSFFIVSSINKNGTGSYLNKDCFVDHHSHLRFVHLSFVPICGFNIYSRVDNWEGSTSQRDALAVWPPATQNYSAHAGSTKQTGSGMYF